MPTKGLTEEVGVKLPAIASTPAPAAAGAATAAAAYPGMPPVTNKQAPPSLAAVQQTADGIATVKVPPQVQTTMAAAGTPLPAPGQDKVVVVINRPDYEYNTDRCACTTGWLLFGLGWVAWPLWVAGALLPLCDKGATPAARANNRRAAIGSAVLAVVTVALLVVVVVVAVTAGASAMRSYNDYAGQYYLSTLPP